MRLTVKTKLLGVSGILIAFMLALGLLSIVSLGTVSGQAANADS